MAISFPSNIKLNAKLPLDERQVVQNSAARLALKYAYPGLVVFEQDTQKLYLANKGENDTISWCEIGSNSNLVVLGYYYNNKFYRDEEHEKPIDPNLYCLYVDNGSEDRGIYVYNKVLEETEYKYIKVNNLIDYASNTQSGIAKLYNELGNNVDGSCTQQLITNELKKKSCVTADIEQECIIVTNE